MMNPISKTRIAASSLLIALSLLLLLPYIPGLRHFAASIYVLLGYNIFLVTGSYVYSLMALIVHKYNRSGLLRTIVYKWNLQFPVMLLSLLVSGSGSILGFAIFKHVHNFQLSRIDLIILLILAINLMINLLKSTYNFEDIQNFYRMTNSAVWDKMITEMPLFAKEVTLDDFVASSNLTLVQGYIISVIRLFALASIQIYALGRLGLLIANDASLTMWQAIQSALSLGPFNFKSDLFSGSNWSYYKLVFQLLLLIWLVIYVALSDLLKPDISEAQQE